MAGIQLNDNYEHLNSSVEYILENVLSEAVLKKNDPESLKLIEEYNSVIINFCDCLENCEDLGKCSHGGNYILDELANPRELVLNQNTKKDIFFECSDGCKCEKSKCLNRLVQYGPRKGLEIMDSEVFKSKGLRTTKEILKGSFICEYAGELLTSNEAKLRNLENQKNAQMNYIICLKEHERGTESNTGLTTFVDPSLKGNIGRYLNHSCDPNCEIFSIRVDCPIPKLCIFSKRLIIADEELCFHYGGGIENSEQPISNESIVPCLCNSKNCLKFLPNIEF